MNIYAVIAIGLLAFLIQTCYFLHKIDALKEQLDSHIDRFDRIDKFNHGWAHGIDDKLERLEFEVDQMKELKATIDEEDEILDDEESDIHLISKWEYYFDNSSGCTKNDLAYYPETNTFQYTKDIINGISFDVSDAEGYIGDALRFFGYQSESEPNVVYFRNENLKADFMIIKVTN